MIIVRSEGRNQLSTIQLYYNFVSATPISDSRKCTVQYDSIQVVQDDSIQFCDILEGKEMT